MPGQGRLGQPGLGGVPGEQPKTQVLVRIRVGRRAAGLREGVEGGQGAGRSAELCGQRGPGGREAFDGVEHQRAPAGGLEAEGGGHGVLGEGASGDRRVAVLGGEPRQGVGRAPEVGEDGFQSPGGDQHGRRVHDVLAGGAAVHMSGCLPVLLGDGGGEVGDERDDRIAAGAGAEREVPDVEAGGPGGGRRDGPRRRGGREAQRGLGAGQRGFGVQHRSYVGGVTGGGFDR